MTGRVVSAVLLVLAITGALLVGMRDTLIPYQPPAPTVSRWATSNSTSTTARPGGTDGVAGGSGSGVRCND